MYSGKKVVQIIAVGINNEIGKDNKLIWSIKEELEYFKEQTLGHVVLMGRKTFESLPKKLGRRITVCASRRWGDFKGFKVIDNCLNECVACSDILNTECIFVAGGGQLYQVTEDITDEILLTKVGVSCNDADTYYNVDLSKFEVVWQSEVSQYLDRLSNTLVDVQYFKYKRIKSFD